MIFSLGHSSFKQAGSINTGFLELHGDEITQKCQRKLSSMEKSVGALAVLLIIENRVARKVEPSTVKYPLSNFSGSWRIGGFEGRHRRILQQYVHPDEDPSLNNAFMELECFSNKDGSFDIRIGRSPNTSTHDVSQEISSSSGSSILKYHLHGTLSENGKLEVIVNTSMSYQYSVAWKEDIEKGKISVHLWPEDDVDGDSFGMDFEHPLPSGLFTAWKFKNICKSSSIDAMNGLDHVTSRTIKSPMPGRVTKIYVGENDTVEMNQVLIVIEAMKMEHAIKSPISGRISRLNTNFGSVVNDGDVVAVVEE